MGLQPVAVEQQGLKPCSSQLLAGSGEDEFESESDE